MHLRTPQAAIVGDAARRYQAAVDSLSVEIAGSVAAVPAAAWDAMAPDDDPFLEHAFFSSLEASGSVGERTAWRPRYLLARRGEALAGAVPLWEKHDSFGEFIFDFGFAHAALRAGIPYYPKLLAAVPFTPVTGPRLLCAPGDDKREVARALVGAAQELVRATPASSLHFLFVLPEEQALLEELGLKPRLSYQFQLAADPGWRDFEGYLAALRAPSRKQVRKERRDADALGLSLAVKTGPEMTDAEWAALDACYRNTAMEKGGRAFLTPRFWPEIRARMPERVVGAFASRDGVPRAAASFFSKGRGLYGRWWGALEPLPAMHFELCYYRPLAWALERGKSRIEAGAQGEHKLKRGYLARPTYSSHSIAHPDLAQAVYDFLPREAEAVRREIEELSAHGPFRRG